MENEYDVDLEFGLVEDDGSVYNSNKDFTTLDACKKARNRLVLP